MTTTTYPSDVGPADFGPADLAPTVVSADRAEKASGTATCATTRTRVFRLTIGFGLALGVVGAVLLGVGTYTRGMIRDQLVSQQIQFPPADSPGMTAAEYPGLQQYAGQIIDDGPKAKAWADQFMTPHILELSGGLPYGVYSAQAFMNPQDEQMAANVEVDGDRRGAARTVAVGMGMVDGWHGHMDRRARARHPWRHRPCRWRDHSHPLAASDPHGRLTRSRFRAVRDPRSGSLCDAPHVESVARSRVVVRSTKLYLLTDPGALYHSRVKGPSSRRCVP